MKTHTMLVGTDFSEASIWAAQHAGEFASKLNYEIHLVHITDPSDHHELPDDEDTLSQLDDVAEEIRKLHGVEVRIDNYHGDAGRTLARLSKDNQYVMVAAGYSGRSGFLSRIGSVAAKTIRLVDKPILILVPSHHTTGPVLGCIDFSDGTEKINFWTHCMAGIREKEPVFVHVAVPYEFLIAGTPNLGGIGMTDAVITRLGGTEQGYKTRLEASIRHRLGLETKGKVEILLSTSAPKAISDYAEQKDASLVIVARHGHNTFGSKIVGTTAEYIMGHSSCSTLILP